MRLVEPLIRRELSRSPAQQTYSVRARDREHHSLLGTFSSSPLSGQRVKGNRGVGWMLIGFTLSTAGGSRPVLRSGIQRLQRQGDVIAALLLPGP